MPYTAPTQRAAGFLVTDAVYNADLVDNIAFLANPPSCHVYNAGAQTLTDNTETTVTFDTERYDTNSMHDTGTNTGRITFNTAGLYVVGFHIEVAAAADYAACYAYIRPNGSGSLTQDVIPVWANASFNPTLNAVIIYKFAVNDYVEVRAFQDNTASAARSIVVSTRSPQFWATWVGLG